MNRSAACRFLLPVVLLIWLAPATHLRAYNPPEDTSGSLRVRLVGPSEIERRDQLSTVDVILDNSGDQTLKGTVRLGVIDCWSATPSRPIPFELPGRETTKLSFQVTAGPGTYIAHYPIHAFVDFHEGIKHRTAHPILIVETKVTPPPHRAPTLPWEPTKVAVDSSLALWQVPIRRTIVQVFDEAATVLPVGSTDVDPKTLAHVTKAQPETLAGQTRLAIVAHPPWHQGQAGTVAVEFPLELPDCRPIKLTFANAMQPGGQSDGVTFRVRIVPWEAPAGTFGEILFDRHTDSKQWQIADVDLSAFSGQRIRLQLESHPGPKKNTGWDRSFWAEPTLLAGTPAPTSQSQAGQDDDFEMLGKTTCGNQSFDIQLWAGQRGLLDAIVGICDGKETLFLRGFEVTVLGARLDDPRSPMQLTDVVPEPAEDGVRMRHLFQSPYGPFELVISIGVQKNAVSTHFAIENAPQSQPWLDVHLEDVAVGRWSEPVIRVYAGPGNVICQPKAFKLSFDGHRLSTSFVGFDFEGGISLVEASDVPPSRLDVQPDNQHASLHSSHSQTRTWIPTHNVWQAVKQWRSINGLKPASGVENVAGKFVFDLWGGRYAGTGEALQDAFRYGLTDSMVIWHNWQRWGYDYRLPEIYPPNPKYGTHLDLRKLIDACRSEDVLFALHDNYIDFYPDADGFSFDKTIAFHQNGTPVRAWLNKGREAQSYRYRADCSAPFLKENLRRIQKGLRPSAYFIDVWSSIGPYDYWTSDGQFRTGVSTRDTWRELFGWIRQHQGNDAPQISESGHDQLIGWLDGATTNHLRVGQRPPGKNDWTVIPWECSDAERTPWFDAAHHDRFILHGAGYESRYAGGLDRSLHGIYSDDYLSTEVLTGHPAMVSRPFGRDVVRKYWLTHDLMRALALRTLESVEYVGGDIHRQHVHWSGGAEVWVNRGQSDWTVAGVVLPEFGFLARVPTEQGTVVASVQRRDGLIVESSESTTQCYYNARSVVESRLPVRLSMKGAKETVAWRPPKAAEDPTLLRRNPEQIVIDFGPVATNGGVRLTRNGQALRVMPLPGKRLPSLDVTIRWSQLPWDLPRATRIESRNDQGRVVQDDAITSNGDSMTIHCPDNASEFRLSQ